MGCHYCDSNNITTNGTAGWFCNDCSKFFDNPWYAWEHEEETSNAERFIKSINKEKDND